MDPDPGRLVLVTMALDNRYRWVFPVRDAHGREATFAVGIEDGRVIMTLLRGFGTFNDPAHPDDPTKAAELAEQAGYSLVTASYVARGLLPPTA